MFASLLPCHFFRACQSRQGPLTSITRQNTTGFWGETNFPVISIVKIGYNTIVLGIGPSVTTARSFRAVSMSMNDCRQVPL